MDNFGRNVHKVFVHGPLKNGFNVLVHAVNRASVLATAQSFFERYEKHEVNLTDAPQYCITIPDLGITHDAANHTILGAAK